MKLSSRARRRLKVTGLSLAVVLAAGATAAAVVHKNEPAPPASQKAAEMLAAGPATSPATKFPVMAIIGDSYAIGKSEGWARRTAFCSAHRLALSGVGGSGFIDEGDSPPFWDPKRMDFIAKSKPDIVIFESAYNDSAVARRDPEAVERSAVDTINKYKKLAPNAKFVILGPFAPGIKDKLGISNNLMALQNAAKETGALHISGLSWLPTPDLIGYDKKHPNDKGNRRITAHLVDSLKAEGLIESTGGCGLA